MDKKFFRTGLVLLALLMIFAVTNSASAHGGYGRGHGHDYGRGYSYAPYHAPRVYISTPRYDRYVAPVTVRPYYRPYRAYATPGLRIVTPRASIGIRF